MFDMLCRVAGVPKAVTKCELQFEEVGGTEDNEFDVEHEEADIQLEVVDVEAEASLEQRLSQSSSFGD